MSSIDNSFQQLPLKEKQLPSRRNPTTSNFKKFSKPPCFLLSPLPNITLISRKQCSIAYYVDLETPERKKNRASRTLRRFGRGKPFKLTPATRSPTFATSPASSLANPAARNRSCPLETRPPHSTWNCDNANEQCFKSPHHGDELMHRLNSQCLKASLRRKTLLRERKLKIRARLDTVNHRAVLQKHRHSLMLLRSRVRHDFAASAAYLKRQLILQQKTELWSAAVERAQNVALLNRLKKCILLRRAYSERLAELLHSSGAHPEATKSHKRSFQTPARSTNDIFAPTRPILSLPDSAILFCSATDDSPFSDEHDAVSPVFSCPSSCSTEEAGLEPSVLTKPESDDESDAGLEAEELRFSRWRPPINRDTLAELDLEEMRRNVQLRHDLIFDPNLQFRPNVSGESGLAKKARWEQYWEKLRLELEGPSKEVATRGASFIPILIWEAREIMLMLFPFEDEVCQELSAKMDVSLIAQELEHNVFDVIGFVNWLVSTLKVHCAPQRQDATDDIINAIKEGRLASAFRSLFELLELMKLDTANDQLSNIFRPYVLEHAVVFEWRHFKLQLEAGLTALDGTMRWLAQGKARNPGQEFDETFYESVVQLVATSTSDMNPPLPETFQMDGSRLHGFHNDYQDISIMATILLLFRQLAGSRCEFSHLMKMKSELWTLLVEVGTTLEHITAQVLRSAQQIRQRPLSPSERVLMANLVDRTLSSNSKVFKLVQTRVTKVLKDFLVEERKKSTGATNRMVPAGSEPRTNADLVKVAPLNEAILRKYGLLELEDGIFDLAVRIRQLTEHNRAVHIMSYRSIWSSLDAESVSEENDLPVVLSRGLADRSFVEYDGAEEPQKQGSTNNEVAVC